MKEHLTKAGRFIVGDRDEVFRQVLEVATRTREAHHDGRFFWAMSGGSTPGDWYRWCVQHHAMPRQLANASEWFVSDERHVPLSSPDSNFGTLDRLLLNPTCVEVEQKHAWPVDLPAEVCCGVFEREFARVRGPGKAFDLCFLGLGTDGHTASLFPGSPLLAEETGRFFAAVEIPDKGWRLTITPRGLRACGAIVVLAMGAGKREPLGRVLAEGGSLAETPARILREYPDRVTWLVDDEAVGGLDFAP